MLSSRRIYSFFVVSVFLHLSFLAATYLINLIPQQDSKAITVEFVSPPTPTTVAQTKNRQAKKTEALEKQIVEQVERPSTEEAPDTRFLSAQNQKVEKQTVAKNRGEFKNSKQLEGRKTPQPSQERKLSLAEMTPKIGKFRPYDKEAAKNESSEKAETPNSDSTEASATQDYLKDVDQGLETLLNAREFKYYTYYNRIRKQLTHHWEPRVRTKLSQMFKQGRQLASATDRITKLVVVLDQKGNLVKVQMIKDSGVSDLDDAAVEAFQSAAPFPNPPKGIVDSDGTVKIRWDFVLES